MSEEMREKVAKMLKGIDRYNPGNLGFLEDYVTAQLKENFYDLEANLTILKLYQFNPNYYRGHVVVNILLKCLTNMPHTDFILCKCLIDPVLLEDEMTKKVTDLHSYLETCQFKQFWMTMKQNPSLTANVAGFDISIRKYICHVIDITYQHIDRSSLADILGGVTDATLEQLMQQNGWKQVEDGYIFVANQEENIKTKNITEKIDFDNVAQVLAAYP